MFLAVRNESLLSVICWLLQAAAAGLVSSLRYWLRKTVKMRLMKHML